MLELLTRVKDGNHLLSTSIIPPISPTPEPELEAALAAKFTRGSLSKCRSSMVLTASMARTRRRQTLRQTTKNYSRISSFMVQKTTRYITYLNEGSITFNVKVGWRGMGVWVGVGVGRWARA